MWVAGLHAGAALFHHFSLKDRTLVYNCPAHDDGAGQIERVALPRDRLRLTAMRVSRGTSSGSLSD
jgi:hypothetical protein